MWLYRGRERILAMSVSPTQLFDAPPAATRDVARALADGGARAHAHPRRRDGHADPGPRPRRGPFPRRAVRRLRMPPQGRQRSADADPAAGDRGHPFRLCDGRRRHSGDQHLLLDARSPRPTTACRRWSTNSTATAPGWPAAPRSRPSASTASAASSPARWGRPTAPPRSRPTSTIPAFAPSPSTNCARPMPSRSSA